LPPYPNNLQTFVITTSLFLFLPDVGVEVGNLELSTASGERLGTELEGEKVLLAGRVSLSVGKVVPELLDIRVEVGNRARGNEAVDSHATVHAGPELPGAALDVGTANSGTNGLHATISSEPDHKLVVTAVSDVVRVRSSEKIVGNVGANVGAAVGPSSSGLHVGDGADEALVADLKTGVGVGLDVVLAAGPGPVGVPASTVAVGPVKVSALRTRTRALAPTVVVELVATVGVVGVLVAERLGQCHWGEKPGEECERGLHCDVFSWR
jgi:S-adenosylmethionine/arginine decarboxylase-like enzyme